MANKEALRIDAHVHFWKLERDDYTWMTPDLTALFRDFGPEDLIPLMKTEGIDKAVIIQAAATVEETLYILDIAKITPFIAGVIGWVDMEAHDVAAELDELCKTPLFKGVRPMIHDIPDINWMLQDNLKPAFQAIAQRDLAFDFLVRPQHLKNLHKLLIRENNLRAIIDHCAKPAIAKGEFNEWAQDMRQLANDTNVMCKLSGLITEAGPEWSLDTLKPYTDHIIDCFGPDRLVWGSDWPVLTMAASYQDWRKTLEAILSELSEHERSQVLGSNAACFYQL